MSDTNDGVSDNPLVQADGLYRAWSQEVKEYMQDEDLDTTLDIVVKMIANPNIPPQKVAAVCVQLEAMALKFRTQYSAFMSYKKGTTEANMKKNHYKELYTGIDRLVDSLKYLAK